MTLLKFKHRLKFFIFLLGCIALQAQTETSSVAELQKRLEGCYVLVRENPAEALKCYEKLLPQLEEAKYYKGISDYYAKVSGIYLIQGENQKTENLLKEARQKYMDHFSEEDALLIAILEIRLLEARDEYPKILELTKKLMVEAKLPKYKGVLHTYQGLSLQRSGHYQKAATEYYKALKIFKSIHDTENIITLYNRLGLLKLDLHEPQKALKYYQIAMKMAKQAKSTKNLQIIYYNLAITYKELDSLQTALDYYKKSEQLAETFGNQIEVAQILHNTGDIYLTKGEFQKAISNFQESLQISQNLDIPIGMLHNYVRLGKAFFQTGDYGTSRRHYEKALGIARSMQMPPVEAEVYYGLYELYYQNKDFEKAIDYYLKSEAITNEMLSQEKQKAIAELEIKYETELKDEKLEKMNYQIQSKQAQNRLLILGLVFLVLLCGFIVYFLLYRNKTLRELYNRNIELLNAVNFYKIAPEKTDERDQLKKIFDKLLELLIHEKTFKDPNLGIKDVAEMIGTNEKYVSTAISMYAQMNYSNFISFYRINEAKELINQMEFANLNEIMYACGFNSRTTFYNAFKNFTGLSPKQFKEMHQKTVLPVENP